MQTMNEQLTLFHTDSKEDVVLLEQFGPICARILDENGMSHDNFELRTNKGYKAAKFQGSVVFSYKLTGKTIWIKFPVRYRNLFSTEDLETASIRNGIIQIKLSSPSEATRYVEMMGKALDAEIDNGPREYSCCSHYQECSDAGHCVNQYPAIAAQCRYKIHLKHGENFFHNV